MPSTSPYISRPPPPPPPPGLCCVSSFVCYVSELRSFYNSFTKCFIYVRLSIASKCLNFLWCVFIKCVYKLLREIWVIHAVACWENFLCTRKADHTWFFQIPLILTASYTDEFFAEQLLWTAFWKTNRKVCKCT